MTAEVCFQVGEWQVRPPLNEIQKDGEVRHLEPRVMDVLVYFASHPGEVLTKERLIQAVWPDTFVTDDALKQAIVSLRKALDDSHADPRYLRTISRRGYLLLAEVSFPDSESGCPETRDSEPEATRLTQGGRQSIARQVRRRQNPEEARSPYPGLAPFTEQDAALFFGREAEIAGLWERIETRRMLGVIGPSGAGKTSFLRAGVIPARPAGWGAVYATPGSNPVLGLARALTAELTSDAEAMEDLLAGLAEFTAKGSANRLAAAVKRWRRRHREALLVIDQFEELFTLNPVEIQGRFAGLLEALASDTDLHLVLSMRDDFLIRCSEHPALAPVFDSLTPLPWLKRCALRRVIEEPAARQGYRFEDEALVDEIVGTVEGERGSLPLLAFAVSRLWEQRDRENRVLTRRTYLEIGGVEGALAQHAEATLERIPAEHHEVVREVFRNLVTSEGTRSVIDREELLSAFDDRATAEEVLRLLVSARLLTTYEVEGREGADGHHRVEVVHESLLVNWPRLVRWQTQDQEGAQFRDELRQAARIWDQHDRSPDLLWSGTACDEFRVWRERYSGALTTIEADFAAAMEEQARRQTRLRRAFVASVIVVLAFVAGVVTVMWQRSEVAGLRSEAARVLALGQLRLKDDPTEALALAIASLEMSDSEEARRFVLKALGEGPPAREVRMAIGNLTMPSFCPDGTMLAVCGHSTEAHVWRRDGELIAALPGHETSHWGSNFPFWASENLLVTGLRGYLAHFVQVWRLPEGRRLSTVAFDAPTRWQVAPDRLFTEITRSSPQGESFLELRSRRLPDGEDEVLGTVGPGLESTSSWFDPNGEAWQYTKGRQVFSRKFPADGRPDRLLSVLPSEVVLGGFLGPRQFWVQEATGGGFALWPGDDSALTLQAPLTEGAEASGPFRPERSGRWVWSRNSSNGETNARVWSLSSLPGSRPLTIARNGSWLVSNCDFEPSGDWIACSTQDSARLTFWPLPATPPAIVDGYRQIHRPLAFSPDSRWLATSWEDGGLRLWPIPGSRVRGIRQLGSLKNAIWTDLVFDPAGRFLFGVGGGQAWIFPLDGSSGRKVEEITPDALMLDAAVSPDGRFAATAWSFGGGPKSLWVWDLETDTVRAFPLPQPSVPPNPPAEPTGLEGGVASLLFDDDSFLYTAGDGGIRRWDLKDGSNSIVVAGPYIMMWPVPGSGRVCARSFDYPGQPLDTVPFKLDMINLATGEQRPASVVGDFADSLNSWFGRFNSSGLYVVGGSPSGLVRVGRLDGSEPYILAGHEGPVDYVAISPDLNWVASTGEDNTLRLWPMPDLSKPPLHALPHDELMAKLKSLTNLRAVPDPAAENGWKIELDQFPGWKEVPAW